MQRFAAFKIFLASFCLIALLSSGLLHTFVPHHHGARDSHGEERESAIWAQLHQAIQHDQKKSVTAVSETMLLLVVAIAFLILRMPFQRFGLEVLTLDPHRGTPLRRGISPHRAFR